MNDKVQLTQETIVGDDVSTEDIYPNTNTSSVVEDASGMTLTETIERIWAAINNKLARVVNSVNGRTGVVVLDASDVGLENVDNVSFNDIKEWVLGELNGIFENKQIKLFKSYEELSACIVINNLDDAFSPFYVERWGNSDTRPYIGCITLDTETKVLSYTALPISGIGKTDESLVYKYNDEGISTMKPGEMRVKISSEEPALYVKRDGDDNTNGLIIDRNGLGGILHFYDGIYGNPTGDDYEPFIGGLLTPNESHTTPKCTIYIDGKLLGNDYNLKDTSINKNDMIVCNFDDYRSDKNPNVVTLDASKIYIDIDNDFEKCGTGYRVGDVITPIIDNSDIQIKFIVSSIVGGAFEGPVASVNLLYCKHIDLSESVGLKGEFDTINIIRFYNPLDSDGFSNKLPATDLLVKDGSDVIYESVDGDVQIKSGSVAYGLKIVIPEDAWIPAKYQLPDGVDFELTMRGMCIGRVTSAPNERIGSTDPYVIELNSIRPLLGTSLEYREYDTLHKDTISRCIDIKTRKGHINQNGLWKEAVDISGLAIAEDWGTYRYDGEDAKLISDKNGNTLVQPSRFKRSVVLPSGVTDIMTNSQMSSGGLTIMTDMSLCIQPHDVCAAYSTTDQASMYNSEFADNWCAATPYIFPQYEENTPSYVGINLLKVVGAVKTYRSDDSKDIYMKRHHFYNMSGLRIIGHNNKLTKSLMGKYGDSYIVNNPEGGEEYDKYLESLPLSGGLMVNVGQGLEINTYDTEGDLDFNEGGKVCVRVDGQTVTFNDSDELTVRIDNQTLISHDVDPEKRMLRVNTDDSTLKVSDGHLCVNANTSIYHDIDMMSNMHPVVNTFQTNAFVNSRNVVGVGAYVDTKFGLGVTLSSLSPAALKIRIKADDVGETRYTDEENSEYRKRIVALKDDGLMFDHTGQLIAPINTKKGLENTFVIKAQGLNDDGSVRVSETGGIGIKIGEGLAFDEDGKLTLESSHGIKEIKGGFDLNNLTHGNYYATADASDTIYNIPVKTGLGIFRLEHIIVIPDQVFMQKLYPLGNDYINKVYYRYKNGNDWTKWYVVASTVVS